MGCDTITTNEYDWNTRKRKKVFIRNNNMMFGCCGSFRMMDLLEWKLYIPVHGKTYSTNEYIHTTFIDAVIKCFNENYYGKIDNNRARGGTFLLGYKDKLYKIYDDYQIEENTKNFNVAGSGGESAYSSILTSLMLKQTTSPKTIIEIALNVAEQRIVSVRSPFYITKMKVKK
jgi:ATP-dependent protease HslVU (ClpYQ) peptidase subunit